MKLISRLRGRCFCAFCKAERKVYVKKHIDLTNVVGAVFLAMVLGSAYWGAPDPRSLVVFCLTILISEIFVYMRWRSSIVCSLCGFDPVVYKKSPEQAAKLVRSFYVERQENPEFWLTRSPLVERKRQVRAQERKSAEYKQLEAKMLAKRPKAEPVSVKPAIPQAKAGGYGARNASSLASPKAP